MLVKRKWQQNEESVGELDEWIYNPDSFGLKGCDSNALMMLGKKRNKKKCVKIILEKKPLSKSEKRKLKKLKEEKEGAMLVSKSIETMEKYKIHVDAYSLLQSSCNIGQVETKLEKRRRDMYLSKVGLEMQHSSHSFKDENVYAACEPQLDSDDNHSRTDLLDEEVQSNKPVALGSSENPVSGCDVSISSGCDVSLSLKEEFDNGGKKATQEDMEAPPPNICLKSQDCMLDKKEPISDQSSHRIDRPSTAPCVVHVTGPNEVEKSRKDLPIVMMEQEIMEAINDHSTVIICGETGCGKTTQLPQFLYEAGYGSKQSIFRRGIIGVTQPRRIAVLSTAKRVAYELGLRLGKEAGFQVRHDKMIGENSSIKFMTDGILLREVQNNFLLNRYSVIILDEAHERSSNTDILIGMLSRIIRERQNIYEEQQKLVLEGKLFQKSVIPPLKLILMSATLRVEDFISGRRLFRISPPVIEVPTRQFPVTVRFSKRTEIIDYIGQAYKKILSIHKRLPPGSILVFVTGQREVEYLCKKLCQASKGFILNNYKRTTENTVGPVSEANEEGSNMEEIIEAFEIQGSASDQPIDRFTSNDEIVDGSDEYESDSSYDSETDSDLEFNDVQEISEDNDKIVDVLGEEGTFASLKAAFEALSEKDNASKSDSKREHVSLVTSEVNSDEKDCDRSSSVGALCVLPLYAMLPAVEQLRVFEAVKKGERLIVVATNVAETSLTIPGIKYVVDTGREKVKTYNASNGMEKYEVQWISKASASQRAGRAGRTGPGHCYRLYSSAVFQNMFSAFSAAEISKIPVDGVTLLLKSMDIDKVANFPFPTPPKASALVEAELCLKTLEALDMNRKLTPLGKAMSHFPMSPRHSRMLLTVIQTMRKVKGYARSNLVLGYAVAVAAALSLSNPFAIQFEGNESNKDNSKQGETTIISNRDKIEEKQEIMKKKKLKETAKLSREKFANPSSDSLTVAYALQCFELSQNPVEFCKEYALHLKTMEEMSKLRKQLLQLIFNKNIGTGLLPEFSWNHGNMEEVENAWRVLSEKHPLKQNEEELLGQAICAGWADRIAKRVRTSKSSNEDGKVYAVRYEATMVKETVFLHRYSSLAKTTPEFIVYNELLHSKRPYMHGATTVKPDWLLKYVRSLCSFSSPLLDPKPYYEPATDQVLCWIIPTFGPHLWKLPIYPIPIDNNNPQRIAVFAYALLEGQVLPCLKNYRKFMAASPSILLRPEASGQERVGNLLNGLRTILGPIYNCDLLREAWEKNPKKLYVEILGWFQKNFHDHFEEIWSQMHIEILLDPEERFPEKAKKEKTRLFG